MPTTAWERLGDYLHETQLLGSIHSTLYWDQNTQMPKGGSSWRGEQLSLMARLLHSRQSNSEYESYRFNWWCEDEKDFFIKRPSYKSEGEIIARLQGHQLIRNSSYLSDSSGISNIRQVDEHELIFESNYDNWYVLEHTRLIDQDKFRSRTIYSWFKDNLKIVENHHEIRIENPK